MDGPKSGSASVTPEISSPERAARRASVQLRDSLKARKASIQLKLTQRSKTHLNLRESKGSDEVEGYHNANLEAARKWLATILCHPLFDSFIVLLVVINAVAVILQTPNPPDGYVRSDTERAFDFLDLATNICFVIELLLRIFAWTPIKFLTKGMNLFDAIVVAACVVAYFADLGGTFAAFRSLRLLVLLNNISFFETTTKSLKAIIGALAYNLRFIANVLILFLILFAIFAQFAIENFHLSLSRRCVTVDGGLVTLPPRYCSTDPAKGFDCGNPALHVCNASFGAPNHDRTSNFGPGAESCSEHAAAGLFGAAGSGFTSFDNFGEAFLILYQIATMSTWFEYVYALKDSEYAISLFYPICIFVLVSMVSASLFVAVITHGFSQFREAQKIEEDLKAKALKLDRKLFELNLHDDETWGDIMQNKILLNDADSRKMLDQIPDDCSQVNSFDSTKEVEQSWRDGEQLAHELPLAATPKSSRSNGLGERSLSGVGTLPGSMQGSGSGAGSGLTVGEEMQQYPCNGNSIGAISEAAAGDDAAEESNKLSESSEAAADDDAANEFGKPAEYWDTTDSEAEESGDGSDEEVDEDSCWDNCFPKRGDEKPKMCCRLILYNFVKQESFDNVIMTIILMNVACLATIYDEMGDWHNQLLDYFEFGFTGIFTAEALLKIIGLGPYPYFRRRANLFDFVLVVVSCLALLVQSATVSVLRMFRLVRTLRLLRVLRKSRSIRRILDSATHSMTYALNVFLLLFLIFLCYGLVGLTMFGNLFKYQYPDGSECSWEFNRAGCAQSTDYNPRNFDNIYRALHTLFVVTTLDGWEDVMYTAMATSDVNKYLAPIYFISFTIITSFLILNLLVAAILDNLQVSEALDAQKAIEQAEDEKDMDVAESLAFKFTTSAQSLDSTASNSTDTLPMSPISPPSAVSSVSCPCLRKWCQRIIHKTITIPYPSFGLANIGTHTSCQLVKKGLVWGYRKSIVVLVVISMVVLAFDTKHKSDQMEKIIHGVDCLMIAVLTTEMVIKTLANGWTKKVPSMELPQAAAVVPLEGEANKKLTFEEQAERDHLQQRMLNRANTAAYWNVGWNRLDLFILICCVFDEMLYRSNWTGAKLVFRAARALKIISSLEGLQKVAQTLTSAFGLLLQICLLCFVMFLVFSILGVSLFVGKFKSCNDFGMVNGDNLIQSKAECLGNTYETSFGDNVLVPRVWSKHDQTFDNVGVALATLFEITSLDAWSVVMYNAVNIVDDDMQPFPGTSPWNSLFFLFFVFMSSMFILQMFVAVVVDRTNQQSQMRNLTLLLEMMKPRELPDPPMITDETSPCYAKWQAFRKSVLYETVLLPGEAAPNYKRALVYDYFVTGMLWINVAFLLTRHFPSTDNFGKFYETQNDIFLVWYWVEVMFKLLAVGFGQYFTDAWNWLDVLVVLGSSMQYWTNYDKSARAFRVLRIFRLLPMLPHVQALLKCMLRCFWNVSSVLVVLFLFYYMFAISGMQLFVDTKYGFELNANTNFDSFGNSLLTLLRVSSGEYVWLLRDCSVATPKCTVGQDCGSRFAWVFFSVFLTFTSYITFQLFLAVVIDSFAWAYSLEDSGHVADSISADHVQKFIQVFYKYDVLHSGLISLDDLVSVVKEIPEPLGNQEPSVLWMRVLRHELRLMPLRVSNKVSCTHLFMVLAVKLYGKDVITTDTVHDADQREALTATVHFNPVQKTLKASMQAALDLGKVGRMLRNRQQPELKEDI